ncbi:MAG: ABC transporter ATP-binding protein/permease [Rhodospirillales bacterium]|nr:ABC transporter ATP-binding protein/permease [Rhodospirillales bacterium]
MRFADLLTQHLAPSRSILAIAAVAMLGESAAALLSPWLAGRLAGSLTGDAAGPDVALGALVGLWVAVLAAQAVGRFVSTWLLTRAGAQVLAALSGRVFDHVQALPLAYHNEQRRGEVLALLSNDVAALSHFVTSQIVGLLPLGLTLLGALALMAWIDPLVAAVATLVVPSFFLVVKLVGRRLRPLASTLMAEQAGVIAMAEENLALLPLVKAFAREADESRRFRDRVDAVLRLRARQLRTLALLGPLTQFLAGAGILGLLWLASARVATGALTVPELVSLLLYGLLLARPVGSLANLYGEVQHARGAATRLLHVLAQEPESPRTGGRAVGRVAGAIDFEHVSFAYAGGPRLLEDLSLHVEPGETVALTGRNGSGKTTLVHLLLRFVAPTAGTVRLDGVDVRELALDDLRRQFGYVSQSVLVGNRTVLENILFGRAGVEPAALERATRLAQVDAFVGDLPKGYDTVVGDQGVRISAGQRQRIALARALLLEPPILILDETTAMFDPDSERQLIDDCRELLRTRTVILVTHRPASLALADRVLRLDGGRLTVMQESPA